MVTLQNDKLKVQISKLGAELKSVVKDKKEYLHQGDEIFWKRTSPVLFPIVGKINDNTYKYEDIEYNLSQHGFARDKTFELLEEDLTYASFLLTSDDESLQVFPFEFSLIIDYMLLDDEIQVSYKVVNLDEKVIYYQIGGHPAFKINPSKNHEIKLSNVKAQFLLNSNGQITGENETYISDIKITADTFENDALIYNFTEDSKKCATILEDNKELVTMNFSELNLLGIWQPYKKDVPFICLEPWNGIADYQNKKSSELRDKEFINKLEIDQSDIITYTIKFH